MIAEFRKWVAAKTPARDDLAGVYAVIVFLLYSWTLLSSFYRFQAWIFAYTLPEILSIYAYAFVVDFIESILLLLFVLLWDYIVFFPLRDRSEFQARAILLALGITASALWRLVSYRSYETVDLFLQGQEGWWLVTAAVTSIVAVVVSKTGRGRGVIASFAERAVIFLYIYLPLSVISLVVVLVRNFS